MTAVLTPGQARSLGACIAAIARGEGRKGAAASLGISESTLNGNLQMVFVKSGATNIVQAAIAFGLMSWDADDPPWGPVGTVLVGHEPAVGVP